MGLGCAGESTINTDERRLTLIEAVMKACEEKGGVESRQLRFRSERRERPATAAAPRAQRKPRSDSCPVPLRGTGRYKFNGSQLARLVDLIGEGGFVNYCDAWGRGEMEHGFGDGEIFLPVGEAKFGF